MNPSIAATPSSSPSSAEPRLSWLAVAALLLGLLGFATILLLGIIPAVIALICGHVALIKIKHSRQKLRGRLAAIIGLIAGYATVLLTPLLAIGIAVAIPLIDSSHKQNQERSRLDHASELFRSCESYTRDHNERYPENWEQLRGRYLSPTDLERLLKPQHDSLWESVEKMIDQLSHSDDGAAEPGPAFLLVPHERPILRELAGSVMVIREIAPPDVERIVVVYDNGETTMIANPNRE